MGRRTKKFKKAGKVLVNWRGWRWAGRAAMIYVTVQTGVPVGTIEQAIVEGLRKKKHDG